MSARGFCSYCKIVNCRSLLQQIPQLFLRHAISLDMNFTVPLESLSAHNKNHRAIEDEYCHLFATGKTENMINLQKSPSQDCKTNDQCCTTNFLFSSSPVVLLS